MPLPGHYQNAYVTRDIAQAQAALADRYGLRDFFAMEPNGMVATPAGERPMHVKVAFVWLGALQIELIEPVDGHVEAYRRYLPDDPADATPRFHHIALRRDDLDAMRAEIAGLGLETAFEGVFPGFVYVYLDARATLGHYLEYMWASPEGWAMMRWPDAATTT